MDKFIPAQKGISNSELYKKLLEKDTGTELQNCPENCIQSNRSTSTIQNRTRTLQSIEIINSFKEPEEIPKNLQEDYDLQGSINFDQDQKQQKESQLYEENNEDTEQSISDSQSLLGEQNSKEYFREDKSYEKSQEFTCPEDLLKIDESFPIFNYAQFFEIWLYHFIFMFLLGPLAFLLISVFKTGNYKLCHNMFMIPFKNGIYQYILGLLSYSCNLFIISIFVFEWGTYCVDDASTIIAYQLMRITCISIRYALLDEAKFKILRQFIIPVELIIKDFFLADWKIHDIEIIKKEVKAVIKRKELDISYFRMQFYTKLNDKSKQEIEKIESQWSIQKKCSETADKLFYTYDNSDKAYCGYHLFTYLLKIYNKNNEYFFNWKLIFFFASLRPMMGLLSIIYEYDQYKADMTTGMIKGTTMLMAFYSGLPVWYFILGALHEMKRKVCMITQCQFMIRPRKSEKYKKCRKHLPTVRYNDKFNLKSWSIMRDICVDYGKRYWMRAQCNISYVFIYSFYPVGYMLYYFQYGNDNDSWKEQIIKFIIIMTNSIIIWVYIFIFLYYSAEINYFYHEHQMILEQNRAILGQLLGMVDIYLSKKLKPLNFIYKKELEILQQQYGEDNKAIKKHLQQNIYFIEDIQRHLKSEAEIEPFTLFGISVTFTKLKAGASILIAVIGILSRIYIKNIDF